MVQRNRCRHCGEILGYSVACLMFCPDVEEQIRAADKDPNDDLVDVANRSAFDADPFGGIRKFLER